MLGERKLRTLTITCLAFSRNIIINMIKLQKQKNKIVEKYQSNRVCL